MRISATWILIGLFVTAGARTSCASSDPAASLFEPAPRFERFSIEEGLAQSVVLALLEDSRGFLWIGTQGGLNRFDASGFMTFKSDPNREDDMPSSYVNCLAEDRSGAIWVGTNLGLARYDPTSRTFAVYGPEQGLPHERVYDIELDRAGRLWIATREGIARFDLDPTSSEPPLLEQLKIVELRGARHLNIRTLLIDDRDDLWIGGRLISGLARVEGASTITALEVDIELYSSDASPSRRLPSDDVRTLAQTVDGSIWVGLESGLCEIRDRRVSACHTATPGAFDALADDPIWSLVADPAGGLWIGTEAGISHLSDGSFRSFYRDARQRHGLRHDFGNALLIDDSGILWIGTDKGLHALELETRGFDHLFAGHRVWGTLEDSNGSLLIATDSGIYRRAVNGKVDVLTRESSGLPSNDIWTLAVDSKQRIWVGCHSHGLCKMDAAGQRCEQVWAPNPEDPTALRGDRITSIVESDGKIWVGMTGYGLAWLDDDGVRWHTVGMVTDGLPDDSIVSLVDAGDRLLIATQRGVAELIHSEQTIHRLGITGDPVGARATSLYFDGDNLIWFGTADSGLARVDLASDSTRFISEADGLPDNTVYAIVPDAEGFLWLSTNRGIARYEPSTGAVKSYVDGDGLQSNEFNFRSGATLADGRLAFGGVEGLTVFDPAEIHARNDLPAIVLREVRLFNRPLSLDQPAEDLEDLELDWRDQAVTFEIAAVADHQPSRLRYACRLDGFEDDWRELGRFSDVTYTNLDPGSYRLDCRVRNADGIWGSEQIGLEILIEPPFWQRRSLQSVAAVLLVVLLWLAYRTRITLLQRRRRELETLVAVRTASLDSQKQRLERVASMVIAIDQAIDLPGLIGAILDQTSTVTEIEAAAFFMTDRHSGRIELHASRGVTNRLTEIAIDGSLRPEVNLATGHSLDPGLTIFEGSLDRWLVMPLSSASGELDGLVTLGFDRPTDQLDPDTRRILGDLRRHLDSAFLKASLMNDLTRANELKTRVIRVAAHDLRNPIAAVQGFLQLMAHQVSQDSLPKDDLLKLIGRLRELTTRTLNLTERLLDLSLIESDGVDLQLETIEVATVLGRVIEHNSQAAIRKAIQLDLEISESLAETSFQADPMRLNQILDNLVGNAIKFTKPGGKVRLEALLDGAAIRFDVSDNGPGISPDELAQAFESFTKLSARPTAGESSAGLGLAIARAIVELHGGQIGATSTLGEGSTFTFTIPIEAS